MTCKHSLVPSCARYPARRWGSPEGQRSVCGLVLNMPRVFILCERTTLGKGSTLAQSCALYATYSDHKQPSNSKSKSG